MERRKILRKTQSLLIIAFVFGLASCEHPAVFAPAGSQELVDKIAADSTVILQVDISGGIAGIQQQLRVYENGLVVLEDGWRSGRIWWDRFSREQLTAMQQYFIGNGFFLLNRKYVNDRVKDALYYDIFFRHADLAGMVTADVFDAPENLKRLITWIAELNTRLITALDYRFVASADTLASGNSVQLSLTVYNRTNSTAQLNFSDMQEFNFLAFRKYDRDRQQKRGQQSAVWRWDADKAFAQVMHEIDLAAGDSLEFFTTWDGRDNSGRFIAGEYLLAGELVSAPGGRSPWLALYLKDED